MTERSRQVGSRRPRPRRATGVHGLCLVCRYRRRVPSGPAGNSWSTLSTNGQRARYGVSYLRNICAQAGVGLNETPADEDVLAVDCDVVFPEGSVQQDWIGA